MQMWSTQVPSHPVRGREERERWDEVSQVFRWLASGFSDCTASRFELIAAGVSRGPGLYGRLGTHLGFLGRRAGRPYTLRVTHVYHRENGEWKIVHRHGDTPRSIGPPAEASTS